MTKKDEARYKSDPQYTSSIKKQIDKNNAKHMMSAEQKWIHSWLFGLTDKKKKAFA